MTFIPSEPLYSHLVHACGGWSEVQELIDAINGGGGGTGTVTTVSVVTANGVSGVVANPTTTPAITITLGDITPNSVAAVGTVTASNISGTTSGTNTGDQTITLTSDVTGSGTGSFATTIAANAVTYAKFQQVGASSLLGNPTGSLANASEITLGAGIAFSGTTIVNSLSTGNQTANTVFAGPTSGAAAPPTFRPAIGADLTLDASNNLFVGGGGTSVSSGAANICIGHFAGNAIVSGNNNTLIGHVVGQSVTGSSNTVVGSSAGSRLSTGTDNAFFGFNAGFFVDSGFRNTLIGESAGQFIHGGDSNTFIGYFAGQSVNAGTSNTIIGTSANASASTTQCVALGVSAFAASNEFALSPFINFQTWYGSSSTSATRQRADITLANVDNTDATRKYRFILNAWDTAAREVMRGEASGSAAKIGFLGASAALQQTGDIGTALVTFGLMSGSPTVTIGANAVAYSNIQQESASTILGNPTNATANVSEITLGAGIGFFGTAGTQIDSNWTTSVTNNIEIPASSTTLILDDPYVINSGQVLVLDSGALLSLYVTSLYSNTDGRPGTSYTIPDMGSQMLTSLLIIDSGILVEIAGPAASDTNGGVLNLI